MKFWKRNCGESQNNASTVTFSGHHKLRQHKEQLPKIQKTKE